MVLPCCRHSGHAHCMESWFKEHDSCPICRTQIPDKIRKTISPKLLPVPRSAMSHYETALLDGGDMALSLDHMDPASTAAAIVFLQDEAAFAESMVRSRHTREEDRAQARLVVEQMSELQRVRETQEAQAREDARQCRRCRFLWMNLG